MNDVSPLRQSTVTPSRSLAALFWRGLTTTRDPSVTVARVALGAVLLPHGAQHLFGAFGGYGYEGTRDWMVSTLGVPGPLAGLAIVLEVIAPLLLVVGAGGRYAAAWLALFLAVAACTHAKVGFFMNWLGNRAGEGFEYHLLALALAAVVVARGSGAWSLDGLLSVRRARRR